MSYDADTRRATSTSGGDSTTSDAAEEVGSHATSRALRLYRSCSAGPTASEQAYGGLGGLLQQGIGAVGDAITKLGGPLVNTGSPDETKPAVLVNQPTDLGLDKPLVDPVPNIAAGKPLIDTPLGLGLPGPLVNVGSPVEVGASLHGTAPASTEPGSTSPVSTQPAEGDARTREPHAGDAPAAEPDEDAQPFTSNLYWNAIGLTPLGEGKGGVASREAGDDGKQGQVIKRLFDKTNPDNWVLPSAKENQAKIVDSMEILRQELGDRIPLAGRLGKDRMTTEFVEGTPLPELQGKDPRYQSLLEQAHALIDRAHELLPKVPIDGSLHNFKVRADGKLVWFDPIHPQTQHEDAGIIGRQGREPARGNRE